jgi:hypothetical protein
MRFDLKSKRVLDIKSLLKCPSTAPQVPGSAQGEEYQLDYMTIQQSWHHEFNMIIV